MIDIWIVILMLFNHWVGDFLFQNTYMALGKSKHLAPLLLHITVYTLSWIPFSIILWGPNGWIFLAITFTAHFITDFFTSKWTSSLYKRQKFYGFPAFFNVIGLDQVFHYIQLFLTYKLLISL